METGRSTVQNFEPLLNPWVDFICILVALNHKIYFSNFQCDANSYEQLSIVLLNRNQVK